MFQYYIEISYLDGSYWTMIVEMISYILMFVLFQLKLLKYLNGIGTFLCAIIVIATIFYFERAIYLPNFTSKVNLQE